jgi:hypothetical protein
MSWATADATIATALDGVVAAKSPNLRNRETDVPAVVWSLVDSGPTESASGSTAPYHARYEFDCMALSRIAAEDLADSVVGALAAADSFVHARETSRGADVVVRGADKTPLYVSNLSMSITFGT